MNHAVGASIQRADAFDKLIGTAKFTADITLPDMLHAQLLLSAHAHARIVAIDTSAAERLPGVLVVLAAHNTPPYRFGSDFEDQELFARRKVLHRGSVLAAVAAVDVATAAEAVRCIRVEYEPLPAVVDVLEAIQPGAPIVHEDLVNYPGVDPAHVSGNICYRTTVAWGDVAQGFAQADRVYEQTFRTTTVHQGYMEPMATVAQVEANGKVTVWTSTQSTYVVRSRLARLFGLSFNQVRVIVPHVGGGFGGKLQTVLEPYVVLLAQRTRQPVKLVLSREEEFLLGKPRSASAMTLKTGVTNDGRLVARQGTLYFDTGFACHPRSVQIAPQMIRGPYNIPHVRFDSLCVYTNKMGCGSFRGPGGIQAHFASESQIDVICRDLGMDPVEFRRLNAVTAGHLSAAGVPLRQVGMRAALEAAATQARWQDHQTTGPKRGWGVASAEWRLGGGRGSGAWIKLNEDGSVVLNAGITEIGSGSSTAIIQMTAEVLGVRPEQVMLISGDTDVTPFDTLTAASRVTVTMGNAVTRSAQDVRTQLVDLAADRLEANPEDITLEDGRVFVKGSPERGFSIADMAVYAQTSGPGPILGRGAFSSRSPQSLHAFGTQMVEVEVDEETGEVKILRIVAAHDVGKAINPQNVEGQIQGGVTQAIGHALMEHVTYAPDGTPSAQGFLDYKIPTAMDLPEVEAVIVEVPDEEGPFGARGIGEPPILAFAPAVANAIYDAVGIRMTSLPITAEKVRQAIKARDSGKA